MIEHCNRANITHIDLLSMINSDTGGRFKRIATTNGGEYAGPCPFCGGRDRCHIQPGQGKWWCRQCSPSEKWSNAIDYVMKRDNIGYKQACAVIGGGDIQAVNPAPLSPSREERTPSDEWQRAGEVVMQQGINNLRSQTGDRARKWLNDRGLIDETLERCSIGYFPEAKVIEGLWVFGGIIIPWYIEGALWAIKVRLPVTDNGSDKYKAVTWSKSSFSTSSGELPCAGVPLLFGADTLTGKDIIFLCEGEFDTMLLNQETGDLIDCVTLGSCSSGIDSRIIPYLLPARQIYIAYDIDKPGQTAAEKLKNRFPYMKRVIPPSGKDITDSWRALKEVELTLKTWVETIITPSTIPELTIADHRSGDGDDHVQSDLVYRLAAPATSPYLSALNTRIAALEAEYVAMDTTSAPSPEWTVYQDLSENVLLPAEVREQYRSQAETLQSELTDEQRQDDEKFWHCRDLVAMIERLGQERDQALAEGRSTWAPGPADELLRQQKDGSFLPAELGLDQAAPEPTESTVILGAWNRRIFKRDKVKVIKTTTGIMCELI